jgi:hypothetical protein
MRVTFKDGHPHEYISAVQCSGGGMPIFLGKEQYSGEGDRSEGDQAQEGEAA